MENVPSPQLLDRLRGRWADLLGRLNITPADGQPALDELFCHYCLPDRHYHNLGHVEQVLATVDTLAGLATCRAAIELAAWFHDVVYNPRADDNEERSAAHASATLTRLGIKPDIVDAVSDMILATKTHVANYVDGRILLDADLLVLAAPKAVYDAYAHAIRLEFSWVPEDEYRRARLRILLLFLQRHHIYYTELIREHHEAQARENLAREVEILRDKYGHPQDEATRS